jgi:hypothetical protein
MNPLTTTDPGLRPWPRSRRLATAWIATCALLAAGLGADAPPDDAQRAREVVEQQLRAFAVDDARQAYALADPNLQRRFADPHEFLAMVRARYPMVHRPASVLFLKTETAGPDVLQRVRFTDEQGGGWVATYLLHRQQDRQWRITACLVTRDKPRLTA